MGNGSGMNAVGEMICPGSLNPTTQEVAFSNKFCGTLLFVH